MSHFARLIRFRAVEDNKPYFADLGSQTKEIPAVGTRLNASPTFENMTLASNNSLEVTIGEFLAPIPRDDLPIYCVGLNYKSHAMEANLSIPKTPPLWTKPAASLAHPNAEIPINKFCAASLPDYEGELVFVTSKTCRDISPSQAPDYILGYTAGNDLSCRLFQAPDQCGNQYFYAKAFDNFAPIGPVLVSPSEFERKNPKSKESASISASASSDNSSSSRRLVTKLNGEIVQDTDCVNELLVGVNEILSFMSQGTTIPAGTVVMTGTPAGVGVFKQPKARFLRDGDTVEVDIEGIGSLKNVIRFV